MVSMSAAFVASRRDWVKGPARVSEISASSSADCVLGEKAMRNSGKAIIRAPLFFASLSSCLASSRFAVFSVEEVICARAMRVILIGPAERWNYGMLGSGLTLLHYVARCLRSGLPLFFSLVLT